MVIKSYKLLLGIWVVCFVPGCSNSQQSSMFESKEISTADIEPLEENPGNKTDQEVIDLAISGQWGDVTNNDTRDLSLSIKQEGEGVFGSHCFVANEGARIDCPEEEKSFTGNFINGSGIVKFKSDYIIDDDSLSYGLSISGDTLVLSYISSSDQEFVDLGLFYETMRFVRQEGEQEE